MSEIDNQPGTEGSEEGAEGSNNSRTPESILAEMHRRDKKREKEMTDLTSQIAALTQTIAQQQQSTRQITASQSAIQDGNYTAEQLSDLAFKDPAKYAQVVAEKASQAANATINLANQRQQQTNQVMTQLLADYPELSDAASELSVKAVQNFSRMDRASQQDPRSYKEAVRDAAAELGLLVKSKRVVRNDDDGSYVGGTGGGNNNSSNGSNRSSKKEKLSDATLEFAELVGLNIRDTKVVERIAGREKARKKGWNRYE